MKKIRVLLVDDSALVRSVFTRIFAGTPDIELMGCASDPILAVERLRKELPDVLILDLEMPRMDGLSFLRIIMNQRPLPVIICSSLVQAGSETLFQALQSGAVEVIAKPISPSTAGYEEIAFTVAECVRAASLVDPQRLRLLQPEARFSADAVLPAPAQHALSRTTDRVLVMAASTGGTQALAYLLPQLRRDVAGTVIVQHMPEKFTRMFAERLDGLCSVSVTEATDGEILRSGHVLIAPGNRHTAIERSGARYLVRVFDGPAVNRHRPAADVLFRSAATHAGSNAMGILMTGMGADGAQGLKEMQRAGCFTVAQDESTSVVFGMPGAAIELGAAESVVPLDEMINTIEEWMTEDRRPLAAGKKA